MKFRINYNRGFNSEGKVYNAPVISRKLNGYNVLGEDGSSKVFLCNNDITILEISDKEKNLPIEL